MNNLRDKCIAMAVGTVMLGGIATAGATEIPAGNLFYQNGTATAPNVSLIINNPQDMGGGGWIGGPGTYPNSGTSPVLDGNTSTTWSAGTFSGAGMCNVGISQGSYNGSTFTTVPFGAIDTIRVWAENYINSDGSTWQAMPQVVAVAYTTSTNLTTIGNGYAYNSPSVGTLPSTWNTTATILAVNGGTPGTPFDPTDYPTASGWVAGDFSQGTVTGLNGGHSTLAYMDLGVNIPAGATSVMISFGQDGSATAPGYNSPGGLAIAEIHFVHSRTNLAGSGSGGCRQFDPTGPAVQAGLIRPGDRRVCLGGQSLRNSDGRTTAELLAGPILFAVTLAC